MEQTIEHRLARLEAIEAVRALKMKYARLCDARYPAVELSDLFVEDGVWDGGEKWGRHVGRASIRRFFEAAPSVALWAMHYTVSGDINVSDDLTTATALWYLWQPMTMPVDGQETAVFLIADYVDEYVKDPKRGWLYTSLKLNVQALSPVDQGWVKRRLL